MSSDMPPPDDLVATTAQEQPTLPVTSLPRFDLRSRTLTESIDLGLRIWAAFLPRMLIFSAATAVTLCGFIAFSASRVEWGLMQTLLALGMVFLFEGPIVVIATLPGLFPGAKSHARSQSAARALTRILGRGILWHLLIFGCLGIVIQEKVVWPIQVGCGVVVLWNLLAAYAPERTLVPILDGTAEEDRRSEHKRIARLVQRNFVDLLGISIALTCWLLILTIVITVTVDQLSQTLLKFPLWIGRAYRAGSALPPQDSIPLAFDLLKSDLLVQLLIAAVTCFTFPLVRLAWMVTYFDFRMRDDLWDIEIRMRAEAAQLQRSSR